MRLPSISIPAKQANKQTNNKTTKNNQTKSNDKSEIITYHGRLMSLAVKYNKECCKS